MATSTITVPVRERITMSPSASADAVVDIATKAKADIEGLTAASLADTDPANVGAAADEGVADTASRSDHVHADPMRAVKGSDLTDASPTITISQGRWRVLPAATLSTNRSITLGTSGAVAGDQIDLTRLDVSANTLAVVNGGAGAGTLITFAASKLGCGRFQFDGTNWALRSFGVQ